MFTPPGRNIRSRSLSTRFGLPEKVASLQRNLIPAELNPETFQSEHFAIARNPPKRVTSLGKTGEPVSIHWQDGRNAKVLIRNLDQLDEPDDVSRTAETVLAHIKKFQQEGLHYPEEIYLDTITGKSIHNGLEDFGAKLVEGINELNHTSYEILSEEFIGERYVMFKIGTHGVIEMEEARPQKESIFMSERKSPKILVESDTESDDPDADKSSTPLIRIKNQKEDLDRSDDEGGLRSAIRSGTGEDERPRDQEGDADVDIDILPKLTSKILAGAQEVHDKALGLSEGQSQLLVALKSMYDNYMVTKQSLLEMERQIQATLPPVIALDTIIGFQPDFIMPLKAQTREEVRQLALSYKTVNLSNAGAKLERIYLEGLKPSIELDDNNVAMGQDNKKARVVSVNVLAFHKNAERNAKFAVTSRAGGVIPIILEHKGDNGAINLAILIQRAVDSAVLILDPNKFDPEQARQVQASQEIGGGEWGLSKVGPGAIVAALVPGTMINWLDDDFITRRRIHFVGAVESSVYYPGANKNVTLSHPDYQPALEQILTNNPKKTLVVHATRLGNPNPITK